MVILRWFQLKRRPMFERGAFRLAVVDDRRGAHAHGQEQGPRLPRRGEVQFHSRCVPARTERGLVLQWNRVQAARPEAMSQHSDDQLIDTNIVLKGSAAFPPAIPEAPFPLQIL